MGRPWNKRAGLAAQPTDSCAEVKFLGLANRSWPGRQVGRRQLLSAGVRQRLLCDHVAFAAAAFGHVHGFIRVLHQLQLVLAVLGV